MSTSNTKFIAAKRVSSKAARQLMTDGVSYEKHPLYSLDMPQTQGPIINKPKPRLNINNKQNEQARPNFSANAGVFHGYHEPITSSTVLKHQPKFTQRDRRWREDDLDLENPPITLALRPPSKTYKPDERTLSWMNSRANCLLKLRNIGNKQEAVRILRTNLRDRLGDAERIFHQLDIVNSQQMNKEMFDQLMFKMNDERCVFDGCDPNGGVAELLWNGLRKTAKGYVRFDEFWRDISDALPAASTKHRQPTKGDPDFFVRSNKLNSDITLLESSLRQKLEHRLDDVIAEMTGFDSKNAGCISEKAFKSIIAELQPELSNAELREISRRYSCKTLPQPYATDGMVNYYEFLKPIVMPQLLKWEIEGQTRRPVATAHPRSSHPIDNLW